MRRITALFMVTILTSTVSAWAAAVAVVENGQAAPSAAGVDAPKAGDTLKLGGKTATIKELRSLPLVQNEYSKRYLFDYYGNPKLKQLREQEKLDNVVAAGKDEFAKQVLLLNWTYKRIKKFGQPTTPAAGALDILRDVDKGATFDCGRYADVLVSAAASLGWVDRPMSIRMGKKSHGPPIGGTEHAITEIWSNQYGKWMLFDPTFGLYVEKNGVPLDAYAIRQEWFYGDQNTLDFIMGGKKHKVKDMPIFLANHPGFGNLNLWGNVFDEYAHLAYVPNANPMDAGADWGGMFITKDSKQCDGIPWHERVNPKHPATEPYFPINQAAIKLAPTEGTTLAVSVESLMPNFDKFRYRVDGKEWSDRISATSAAAAAEPPAGKAAPLAVSSATAQWPLHAGANTLEVVAVNKFGIEGTPSKVALEVAN